jgi:hypothetical protein
MGDFETIENTASRIGILAKLMLGDALLLRSPMGAFESKIGPALLERDEIRDVNLPARLKSQLSERLGPRSPLSVWTAISGPPTAGMSYPLTCGDQDRRRRGAQWISHKDWDGRRTVQAGRDEMGSSVEGLKLRRMRVRNEISLNRCARNFTD